MGEDVHPVDHGIPLVMVFGIVLVYTHTVVGGMVGVLVYTHILGMVLVILVGCV